MMRNRAEALFAAKDYVASARQFEELAKYEDGKNAKGHQDAMYGALLSHFSSLKPGEVNHLTAFEVADARQALKLLGASYLGRYPRSEHAVEVKFNIARAFYEDGDYERSAELFPPSRSRTRITRMRPAPGAWRWTRYASVTTSRGSRKRGRSFSPRDCRPASRARSGKS